MRNKLLLDALLRNDFSSFISKTFQILNPTIKYHDNWHIDLMAEYLESVRLSHIKRLIINIPPRMLKSICVSVAWSAWLLGKNPSTRIIAASYSSIISEKHSLDCRFILTSPWYKRLFPNVVLTKIQKNKFITNQNGFRFATSVGGSATGEGGDILIIDDPHNPIQILSKRIRNNVIEWFDKTFITRLNDRKNGSIVLVMQRLHESDLSAYLISSGEWELLEIPAVAEKDISYHISQKSYHYKKDQAIFNTDDELTSLKKIEREMGIRNYSAQFLQKPFRDEFNILNLEEISRYNDLPNFEYYIQSWDTAIKISSDSDYSVCTCWGITRDKYYLVSLIRKKMRYPELKNEIEKQAKRFNPRYILIEDKASGQSVIQDLKSYSNIKAINVKLDKITRFASVISLFQSDRVMIPHSSSYNKSLISELTSFPNSKHDDIVDSVSQFLNFIKDMQKSIISVRLL